MRVVPIPCLTDNYAYLLVCIETKEAAIVDASEAEPVLRAVRDGAGAFDSRPDLQQLEAAPPSRDDVRIGAILSTHHHHDHVGGNEAVRARLGIDRVYGHGSDRGRIPGQTQYLRDGDTFEIGRLVVRALHVPGHTLGAVAYFVTSPGRKPVVFTGDTLFLSGCGRLFEGDAPMMHASLQKLAALDPETRVYCGHEYTAGNLRFAAHLEPSNRAVRARTTKVAELREAGRETVPGTIAEELEVNPFLRVGSPELRATLGIAADASAERAFAAIRAAKDAFAG